jgi:16S rRNA (guanine1516-N2)-methyltransferase
VLVTTSYEPSSHLQNKAKQLAAAWNGSYVHRSKLSLDQLRRTYEEPAVLLVTKEEIRYYVRDQPAAFFHPSMAMVRIKRLLRGETDLLLEAAGVRPGDSVLDCTAGLASDSIVFSFAVGAGGEVTALESEQIPALLIHEGLAVYESEVEELDAAMRRIQVKYTDHLSYLYTLETKSVDTVYFDPMFRSPISESSAIFPLRQVANAAEIALEAIEQAKRVTRHSIVLKEQSNSKEFARLGFDRVLRSNTKTTYGVIRL